jgi:ribosomal-protein-alanine N-acetyltransferase
MQLVPAFSIEVLEQLHQLESLSHSNPWSKKLLEEEFKNPVSQRICLFGSEGEVVAYVFNHLVEDELHVLNLTVSPKFRRRGIGGFLLEEALREASNGGAIRALLEVRPSNIPAVGLYRKLGFKIMAKRKRYYSDNKEDALMLELELGPK